MADNCGHLISRPNQASHQDRRDQLTVTIMGHVREAIADVLAETPADLSSEARASIEGELIANTEQIVAALSFQELQNERAMEHHIDSTVTSARYAVNRAMEQMRRR